MMLKMPSKAILVS